MKDTFPVSSRKCQGFEELCVRNSDKEQIRHFLLQIRTSQVVMMLLLFILSLCMFPIAFGTKKVPQKHTGLIYRFRSFYLETKCPTFRPGLRLALKFLSLHSAPQHCQFHLNKQGWEGRMKETTLEAIHHREGSSKT